MAIDIGSTTIAGHLCELTSGEVLASGGRMNPQIRFGEDLMSRVSYAMMNPGGAAEMTEAVHDAMDTLARDLANDNGIGVGLLQRGWRANPAAVGVDGTDINKGSFQERATTGRNIGDTIC